MRKPSLCLVAGLALVTGCTRWNILKTPENAAKEEPGRAPSVAALVGYLNENSSRLQTIRSTELDMTCSVNQQSFGVRGRMIAQRPRNFLLAADVFGAREVDLGSNDQEFWWWIKKSDPPYQFFCSYKELTDGKLARAPFPFQPDWIIDALGMGTYGPAERFKLEVQGDKLKLVERTMSPQGQPVRKVIVMNRKPVRSPTPQVTAFLLLDDASGREICSAHISETQVDRGAGGKGGILPRRLELRWSMPDGRNLKLALTLDGLSVNPNIPAATFVRRPLQGVPSYDLASGRRIDSPTALRQVQAGQ